MIYWSSDVCSSDLAFLPAISLPVLLPRLYGRAVAAARPVRAAGNAGAATRACGARGRAVHRRAPEQRGMGRLHAAACAVADAAGSRVAPMAPGGRGGTRRLALRAAGGHVPGLLGVERDDLAVEDGRRRPS